MRRRAVSMLRVLNRGAAAKLVTTGSVLPITQGPGADRLRGEVTRARAASIARTRYREGLVDFLESPDAERTQLQAEDAVARAETGVFTGVVAVYKSLGGISD